MTSRELHVVHGVHECKSNKQIARDLVLSEGTIKDYLVTIFKKLNVENRVALALLMERNLLASRQTEERKVVAS